jgi:predicted DNA-binding antitoxin AbrB/MazE fold protein
MGIDAFRTVIQFDELLFQWLKKLPIKSGQDIEIIVRPVKDATNKKKKRIKPVEFIDEITEGNDWHQLSQDKLAAAYSENEPEYSITMVKEPNTDYEGR